MEFSRQYWSGLPFSSPKDLPNPGMEPTIPALAGGFNPWATWEALMQNSLVYKELLDPNGFSGGWYKVSLIAHMA